MQVFSQEFFYFVANFFGITIAAEAIKERETINQIAGRYGGTSKHGDHLEKPLA